MKQNNRNHILLRYGIITALMLLVAAAIVVKLFNVTVIQAAAWNDRATAEMSKLDTLPPERGNILASNGNILACNLTVYDIKLDLRHNKLPGEGAPIPWDSVDAFADSLDVYFPRRANLHQHPDTFAKYSWHTKLKREFEAPFRERKRALVIAKKQTLEDFERVRNFPWMRSFKGRRYLVPVYASERNVRIYPYGKMAHRSIGRVNENIATKEIHGYSGLEKDLDTLLYGKPGLAKRVALTNGISNWVSKAPQRGYDILTTIDIDMQDMLEEELHAVCDSAKAEWGVAILMEVATGEIKAISNLERLDDGTYGEALNRAVLPYEPGSVMKPISMMIAFEDGLVKHTTDGVDCSPFMRTKDPHAPSFKTMKQVIEMSSNTGIARVIFRKYADDPTQWHDRLASIGFFEKMNSGIAGEQLPQVRRLEPKDKNGNNITMTARHLDLARQAYGYNTMIPPLYTLSYYNALANGGKYVRPHLVRALRTEDGRDSTLKIDYIRERICSEETAAKVRECIREVVWGEHGTARAVRDDRVEIAGKTGTAYPVENGSYNLSKRRYAFAGFFPYDRPKYSCMALILGPGGTSANRTSGQVVKRVALKLYARGMLDNVSTYTAEKAKDNPVMTATVKADASRLKADLGINRLRRLKAQEASGGPRPKGRMDTPADVKGYDAPSAIAILERQGYNVAISGKGRVVAQSAAPGKPLPRGSKINLTLKL